MTDTLQTRPNQWMLMCKQAPYHPTTDTSTSEPPPTTEAQFANRVRTLD